MKVETLTPKFYIITISVIRQICEFMLERKKENPRQPDKAIN